MTELIYQTIKKTQQRGSALIMAVFVMVVISLLGATMMELLATSSEGVAQEVLGTRALAAANSGVQGQLQKLFPLNSALGSCPATSHYNFSTIQGLYQCQADVTCSNYVTSSDGTKYYRLKSIGTCGTGTMAAASDSIVLSSRSVQVEARSL
ncbi:MAG: type II secretory pathway component [Gammaproteobacteria bacterium]|nr:MAG: type II secretory pathway component [Gammaproteobacteria bacterium]